MADYAKLRQQARSGNCKRYAQGGRVRGGKTVVNVVVPPSSGGAPTPAGGPIAAPPAAPPLPPKPVPPVAANTALGAMGGAPVMRNGGKVMAGAGSGVGRMQRGKPRGK